jgi:hypothetical protein
MIHVSKLPQIMERKDKNGKPVPFSFKYVKKESGEIINIESAILTSSYHRGSVNVRILPSSEIRKLILPLFIEFNKTTVYI